MAPVPFPQTPMPLRSTWVCSVQECACFPARWRRRRLTSAGGWCSEDWPRLETEQAKSLGTTLWKGWHTLSWDWNWIWRMGLPPAAFKNSLRKRVDVTQTPARFLPVQVTPDFLQLCGSDFPLVFAPGASSTVAILAQGKPSGQCKSRPFWVRPKICRFRQASGHPGASKSPIPMALWPNG